MLLESPLKVVVVVAGSSLVGKTLAAVALVLAFRYPLNTAPHGGRYFAQIE